VKPCWYRCFCRRYDIGVISGAILFIKKDFALSPGLEEIVVSSVLPGSLVGAFVGGILADRLGRRRLLIFIAVVFGSGAIGAALDVCDGGDTRGRVWNRPDISSLTALDGWPLADTWIKPETC
jgi:MFS family permease